MIPTHVKSKLDSNQLVTVESVITDLQQKIRQAYEDLTDAGLSRDDCYELLMRLTNEVIKNALYLFRS